MKVRKVNGADLTACGCPTCLYVQDLANGFGSAVGESNTACETPGDTAILFASAMVRCAAMLLATNHVSPVMMIDLISRAMRNESTLRPCAVQLEHYNDPNDAAYESEPTEEPCDVN